VGAAFQSLTNFVDWAIDKYYDDSNEVFSREAAAVALAGGWFGYHGTLKGLIGREAGAIGAAAGAFTAATVVISGAILMNRILGDPVDHVLLFRAKTVAFGLIQLARVGAEMATCDLAALVYW
jgi:hypothetical protein